jgi:glycosyltransferase involved in cell wall biosynthesis
VLLPVYNGGAVLSDSIKSILDQTYRNFELIIIDDGSTDDSASIIREFDDARIRSYNQRNRGLAGTLNRAIELSTGEYIARQDQDDLAYPQRLAKQIEFLETRPHCAMVGTWASIWTGEREASRVHRHPTDSLVLKFELLFDNPFVHSTIMVRKSALAKVGFYDELRQPPEDYELWSRIARKFEVANIPEILEIYREVPSSMSRAKLNPFLDRVIDISAENIAFVTGRAHSHQVAVDLSALARRAYHRVSSKPSLMEITALLLEAARKLCSSSNSPPGALGVQVKSRLLSIRQSYYYYRYGIGLNRIMAYLDELMKRNGYRKGDE